MIHKSIARKCVFSLAFCSLSIVSLNFACSADDDDDETTATTTSSNPEASSAAANITEGSAASLMESSSTVIKSAQVGTLNVGLSDTQSTNDANCSSNGDPWDADSSAVRQSGTGYVGHKYYCKLNSGTIESVDTIPGFIRQQQSIFCSIEEALGVTVSSFTSGGTELVSGESTTMTLSDACWPQGQPDGTTSVSLTSVTATLLDSSTDGWQYKLAMTSPDVGSITVKYFNSNGVFGFQNTQAGNDPGAGTDIKVVIDTNNGVLLFNEVEDRNGSGGSDSVYRGLTRMRVKGTLNADLTFSSITEGRGYIYVSGPDFDASANQDHTYSVYTVDGNSTTGWQFKTYSTGDTAGSLSLTNTECTDGDATCSSSEDVATIDVMNAYFKAPDTVRDVWKSYAASGQPMCEPSDGSNSDVTVVAQPVHTGPLGVCSE